MWYYAVGEQQVGPLDDADFVRLVESGSITPATLVWREGLPDWVPYGTIPADAGSKLPVTGTFLRAGEVRCVQCGRSVAPEESVNFEGQHVCAACKPVFFQRLREGNAIPGVLVYASVLRRFGALFLDSLIFNAAFFLMFLGLGFLAVLSSENGGEPSEAVAMLVGFAVILGGLGGFAFYMTWFVGRFGATPGKMVLGIKIVRSDGGRVSYGRAFGRMLAHQLSGMVLYLGYIMAFFDEERRALHDLICDTRVIMN